MLFMAPKCISNLQSAAVGQTCNMFGVAHSHPLSYSCLTVLNNRGSLDFTSNKYLLALFIAYLS
ncbi:unnamed protein product [Ixodes persulcatus]